MLGYLKDFLCLGLHEVDEAFASFVALRGARVRRCLLPIAYRHGAVTVPALLAHPHAVLMPRMIALAAIVANAVDLGLSMTSDNGRPDSRKYAATVSIADFVVVLGVRDAASQLLSALVSDLSVRRVQDLLEGIVDEAVVRAHLPQVVPVVVRHVAGRFERHDRQAPQRHHRDQRVGYPVDYLGDGWL